jgi:hypothetical protein
MSGRNKMEKNLLRFLESEPHSAVEEAILGEIAREDLAGIAIPGEVTDSIFNQIGGTSKRTGAFKFALLLLFAVLTTGTGSYLAWQSGLLADMFGSGSVQVTASAVREPVVENTGNEISGEVSNAQSSIENNAIVKSNDGSINSGSSVGNSNGVYNSESGTHNSGNSNYAFANATRNSDKNNKKISAANDINSDSRNTNSIYAIENATILEEDLGFIGKILASDFSLLSSEKNGFSNFDELSLTPVAITSNINMPFIDNTKYRFQLRFLAPSGQSEYQDVTDNKMYAHTGFSGSYRFKENHEIGIEIGFDYFSQEFASNAGTVDYRQNPLLFYYGGTWKYTPTYLAIGSRVYPYMQLFAGGTSTGPLFKTGLGASVRLFGNMYLTGGAEYGRLIYNVEGTMYNSSKLGATVGFEIRY